MTEPSQVLGRNTGVDAWECPQRELVVRTVLGADDTCGPAVGGGCRRGMLSLTLPLCLEDTMQEVCGCR